MRAQREWEDSLPSMRLTPREFNEMLEYSASLPTGTTPGKRWRRLNGAHDPAFLRRGGKPRWIIGQFDPSAPSDAEIEAMKKRGQKPPSQIRILWFRPIICVSASTVAPVPDVSFTVPRDREERDGMLAAMEACLDRGIHPVTGDTFYG